MAYKLKYRPPGPVGAAFLTHKPPLGESGITPIDIIIGPVGSGKSVASAIRLFLHGMEQQPGSDGWRRTRWAVVRNTNPMLETTTIPTWLEWFPEQHFGRFNWSPPYSHIIRLDDVKVEIEVWFVPLDRPDQVRNVLSMELTGAWVNEMREIPREIVIELRRRCGRFPSARSGVTATWAGIIGDTNAPEDELHYLAMWAGWTQPPEWLDAMTRALMYKPDDVTIFVQPPGLTPIRDAGGEITAFEINPNAENLKNLRGGSAYYTGQLSGSTTDAVLNMICVECRKATAVRRIHNDFRRAIHVAPKPLQWETAGRWGLFGADWARNPAVVLGQEVEGQLRILAEWIGQNISVEQFFRTKVMPDLRRDWPQALDNMRSWGDPSGIARTGSDDTTAFTHARKEGFTAVPCWTNDPEERQAALDRRLNAMIGGKPAILLSPKCQTLIGGLEGGYRLRRLKVEGTIDRYTEEPEKNLYSHICEALQYLCAGHDRRSRRGPAPAAQPNGRVEFDPFTLARMARKKA